MQDFKAERNLRWFAGLSPIRMGDFGFGGVLTFFGNNMRMIIIIKL